MVDIIFGNTFDLNHDDKIDDFERMMEYHAVMNDICRDQKFEKPADEMRFDELDQLAVDKV